MTPVDTNADRAARDLAARFADAINRRDRAAFAALWWDEGVWELTQPYPMVASGLADILTMYDRLMAGWEFFAQLVHSGVVELDEDRAHARWSMREVARAAGGIRSYDNLAIYDDTMERHGREWRFSKRRYCYVWVDETAINGRAFPLPDDLRPSLKTANG